LREFCIDTGARKILLLERRLTAAAMAKLSGEDIAKLASLLASTLDFADLQSFVYASTGDQLYDAFVAKDQPKIPMIRALLIALEGLGTTRDFLAYVYVNRPGRQDVRAAIAGYFPDAVRVPEKTIDLAAQTRGAQQSDAPENALAPGFQRNIRPYLPKLDVRIWQEKLLRIERQVCRVEMNGNALGTGFLVGADAVLTNWHVVEAAKSADKVREVGCRFDYVRRTDDTTDPGQLVALAEAAAIDTSPYSSAEKTATPDTPAPTRDELDYALLRLSQRVGDQQIEGAARKWIALPTAVVPLPTDAPILIVQHPDGSPMKLALDTQAVIGLNGNGTRLRYRTNTDPGSSGSPVFTVDWEIVALHHYGDPKWLNPAFNQGVPIELIRQRIDRTGFASALGA
jgi:Trypsin-like peptidase domain